MTQPNHLCPSGLLNGATDWCHWVTIVEEQGLWCQSEDILRNCNHRWDHAQRARATAWANRIADRHEDTVLARDKHILLPCPPPTHAASNNASAVPSAVVHADCVPVLVEVGPNYRVDMDDFAAKLDGAAAVLISHMRGHTSDMDAIMALCDARDIPVIEDAAHSLGTEWRGKKIGTVGKIGCFSFQSYKMVNAGEGGILITDDPELAARCVIMSGAYENNWKKHPGMQNSYMMWQNKLPLYNMRMQNLSAAVIRPQLPEVAGRVAKGRAGHDLVADRLNLCPWLDVPPPLGPEQRAPDSIQFNLEGQWSDADALRFQAEAKRRGVAVQVFGLSDGNARAFWNWEFLGPAPDLPMTRAMLMRACDVRLPTRLTVDELNFIASAIVDAALAVKG